MRVFRALFLLVAAVAIAVPASAAPQWLTLPATPTLPKAVRSGLAPVNGIEMAQASDDEVTADLLVGALGEYEKSIWMLNAMLA